MYAVVLSYELRPHLHAISEAHCCVATTMLRALRPLVPGVRFMGTSDLALDGRKFSGNSLRARRTHLLYHGTLLYDFPLELIAACLGTPPRQPDYRQDRTHREFLMNLCIPVADLRTAIADAWMASESWREWPREATEHLVAEKYGRREWNFCL
jgi:lipoate-protein ligase A